MLPVSRTPRCGICPHRVDTPEDSNAYAQCKSASGMPCSLCVEYIELEAQVEETRALLEAQLVQLQDLRKAVNNCHDPVMLRTPREIAIVIFEFAISDFMQDILDTSSPYPAPLDWALAHRDDAIPKKFSTSPFTLGAVCGAWRDILWTTPRFWAFVPVHISRTRISDLDVDIVREWLARSANVPLSIYMRVAPMENFPDRFKPRIFSLIDLFNSHSTRWEELRLFCPKWALSRFTGNTLGAPNLRHLAVFATGLNIYAQGAAGRPFSLQSKIRPRPRSLKIQSFQDFQLIDADWSDLTKLTTDICLKLEHGNFLNHVPKLEHWSILSLSSDVSIFTSSPTGLRHPRLRYLHIADTHKRSRISGKFLNYVAFPALKTLSIGVLTKWPKLLYQDINAFVQRSSCTLLAMSIRDASNASDLLEFLESMPSLEELELKPQSGVEAQGIRNILVSLSLKPEPGLAVEFLPNLRRLKISTPNPRKLPWYIIPDIFDLPSSEDRRRPLTSLTVRRYSEERESHLLDENVALDGKVIKPSTAKLLLALVNDGIEVNLPTRLNRSDLETFLEGKPEKPQTLEAL